MKPIKRLKRDVVAELEMLWASDDDNDVEDGAGELQDKSVGSSDERGGEDDDE